MKFTLAGVLASRLGRFCSHPLDYPGGRYPLPCCRPWADACPDFPLSAKADSDCL